MNNQETDCCVCGFKTYNTHRRPLGGTTNHNNLNLSIQTANPSFGLRESYMCGQATIRALWPLKLQYRHARC